MKIFYKAPLAVLTVVMVLGLIGPSIVFAATTPSLGAAASYGVLSSTFTNGTTTTVNGDVGFTTGPAVAPLGAHTYYGSGAPYSTAGTDQNNALSALSSQPCTFTFAPGAIDLATDTTHGPIGIYRYIRSRSVLYIRCRIHWNGGDCSERCRNIYLQD